MSECLVGSLRPNEGGNCVLVQEWGQGRLLQMWEAEIAMRSNNVIEHLVIFLR